MMHYSAQELRQIEEQVRRVKAGFLAGKRHVQWIIHDRPSLALPEKIPLFGKAERKRLLEKRHEYICRLIGEGELLRYDKHVCVARSSIALDFLIEWEVEAPRIDSLSGEVYLQDVKLQYQGYHDRQALPATRLQARPHQIVFSNRLVDDWDFLRALVSERQR